MKLHRVELRTVDMPLVRPFRTSQSLQLSRLSMLVRVVTDVSEGWADLSVEDLPVFGHEFIASTWVSLREVLLPTLLAGPLSAPAVGARLATAVGHHAARAALETAVLDAELRAAHMSLSRYLGGTRRRVPVGVSIGITDTLEELVALAEGYAAEGYARVKLKVQPGWDEAPMAAVRSALGSQTDLQVDGNGAYGNHEVARLSSWDRFGLSMIEQPFPAHDVRSHIRLAARLDTPLCLDESIKSAVDAAALVEAGACRIVNVKPSRVGGYLESRRIHDVCSALSVPVWCGGVLESGVGRAANLALASLPNFTLPGDISATSRYFVDDLTAPFELEDGHLVVPDGPGIGVEVDLDAVDRFTTRLETVPATGTD